MPKPVVENQYIQINQLCVGLYIFLDLGWMDHPFSVNNFKITEDSEIETIKGLGLKQLRYDPKRSSCLPLETNNVVEFPLLKELPLASELETLPPPLTNKKLKQIKLEKLIGENEQRFMQTSQQVKNIQKLMVEHPEKAFANATMLIQDLVSSTLTESDIAIHAINGSRSGDQHYQHELNILVLSMMLGKATEISEEEAQTLGMAAILHDIGKKKISDKILLKKDPLTFSETHIYQTHVALGIKLLKELNAPKPLLRLVSQHHEHADGSGYPQGLKDPEIDKLAHILIVADMYDSLCNPPNPVQAKSPYEALSMMFAQQRRLFNESVLRRFIKCLGIYPPGSIIRLSDQRLATVLSTNPQQPLRPFVQIIENSTDQEGIMIDMCDALDINIVQCIKTEQLPKLLQSAARRRQRMSYFLDKALPS